MSASNRDILTPPSVLLQTSPLDTYLRNLSSHLVGRLDKLDTVLAALHDKMSSCADFTDKVHTFLRKQVMLAVREKAAENGDPELDEISLELMLPEFLRKVEGRAEGMKTVENRVGDPRAGHDEKQGDEGDDILCNLAGSVTIRSKNASRMLKSDEGKEEESRRQNAEMFRKVEEMCKELEVTQKRYMEESQRTLMWLRPAPATETDESDDAEDEYDRVESSRNSNRRNNNGCRTDIADPRRPKDVKEERRELLELLRDAPLFVEFRRMLLRDVADRLADAQDQQSMALGSTTAALKRELQLEMSKKKGSESVSGGDLMDTGSHAGNSAAKSSWRLKGLDHSYMRRGEVVALLREKADITTVSQKTDNTCVCEMEKRLLDRIADLEERLSIYEAERREFRQILCAVVDRQQHSSWYSSSNNNVVGNLAAASASSSPGLVVVEDTTDPRHARARGSPRLGEQCTSRRAPPPSFARKGNTGTLSPPSTHGHNVHKRQLEEQRGLTEKVPIRTPVAIGLTANQEAYVNYVATELNRRNIEKLPSLPYERHQPR